MGPEPSGRQMNTESGGRAKREKGKGKWATRHQLAQIDHRQRAREGINLGIAWAASKSFKSEP